MVEQRFEYAREFEERLQIYFSGDAILEAYPHSVTTHIPDVNDIFHVYSNPSIF
jgi:hypothetical protein